MGDEEKQRKVETGSEKENTATPIGSPVLGYNDSDNTTIVERLQERVKELEALVGGKEEALQVALQGLDGAMGVEVEYRAQLEGCRARVGEFQQAVEHRDLLIEQLSASLEHTLRARDELAQDGERLVQEVSLLRSQLQATSDLVAQGSSKSQHDFMLLQNRMLAVEDTSKKKDLRIEELQRQLTEQQDVKKELELKKAELSQYKTEAAADVQHLMREVERLHREAASSLSLERQRAQQVVALDRDHKQQMVNLRAELEEHFGQQLVQIKEKHRLQFSEQLEVLKKHHSEELASASIASSSSEEGIAQQQLQELSERALHVASERENLLSQLALYKEQVQNLTEELLKYSAEERNDAARHINLVLKNENTSLVEEVQILKEKLRSVEDDKMQELKLYQHAQVTEVSSWKRRVDSLTLEMQKVSEVAQSYLQQLEGCTKVHEAELTALQKTHAQELKFLGEQVENMHQFQVQSEHLQSSLEEKTAMEKRLQSELQTSIRTEEDLKGRLLQVQDEMQVLRVAFEQQKEFLQQQAENVEKLRTELCEKETMEVTLKEELKVLTDRITTTTEAGDIKIYKEQIDRLNDQLQQKTKLEEMLKHQMQEKEKIEEKLRNKLEEQTKNYEAQLITVYTQLQEKTKIEEQLRMELLEKIQKGEQLHSELKTLKHALDELKETTQEVEAYKTQVDSLNRQLQECSQTEHKIICDYESRVKTLTFDLNTIESRLSSEIQDIQRRAQDELLSKQEAEKHLEGELEAVRSELLALKKSSDVQEYKEQINELNLLVQEKQKAEEALKAELQVVSTEVATLKENQQYLENLNFDLEERLQTEQRLQEELIAATKMHKEQVDVLSAKISELTSQQNSLDNEAISMRHEIDSQKSYIHDLELIREQVSESSRTKEALINDLSVCVRSLTEDNASYQQKLEQLNKRLDDECHRADENMKLREEYEGEITKHKQHIEELKIKLQEAMQIGDQHLGEISVLQQQVKGYKEQLEQLNTSFTEEITRSQQEYSRDGDKAKQAEILAKELTDTKTEMMMYQKHIEELNGKGTEKEKMEVEYKTQVQTLSKQVEDLKIQLLEMTEMKKKQEEEMRLCAQHLEEIHVKLRQMEEDRSKNTTKYLKKVEDLEVEVVAKNEHISKLSSQMEEAASNYDDLNKLLLEAQKKFAHEKEIYAKLFSEKEDADANFRAEMEKISEMHRLEVEEYVRNMSTLQSSLQELTVAQERCSRDRDSLNLSSISETELSQLESKLQHVLNEKNEIEKSFKDHINKLAESHLKEVAVYNEQLQMTHEKLNELTKTHRSFVTENEALRMEISKLMADHENEMKLLNEKLKIINEQAEQLTKDHTNCFSEKETLKNNIHALDKQHKEELLECKSQLKETIEKMQHVSSMHNNCVSESYFKDHVNNLCSSHEREIMEYVELLKKANEKQEELSRCNIKYVNENDSLKDNVTKLSEIHEEVTLYKEQLKCTSDKLEELSQVHRKCVSEKDIYVQNTSEKECALVEKDSALQKKNDALIACQNELVQTQECMECLKMNVQDEVSKVCVELRNLVNICVPNNETVNEEEVSYSRRSSEELSFTNGLWNPDLLHNEGHGSLQPSSVCAAIIHQDVSVLRGHVERLVSDLNAANQKSSTTERLLAARKENEVILKKHIEQLEGDMRKSDADTNALKEQLEDLTVKLLTSQSLLAGKVEAEQSLQKEDSETEVHVCNRCKNLEEEVTHITSTVSQMDENLKSVDKERDRAINRCKELEEEYQKLLSEKVILEKVVGDLKQKIERSPSTHNSSSNSEETWNMSEDAQSSVVIEYNTLKKDHKRLLSEKHRVEEILEETKAEVVRLREFQNETLENFARQRTSVLEQEVSSVEKGTQEQIDNVKEEASQLQGEFDANCNDLVTAIDFTDLSFHGVEESDASGIASMNAMGDAGSLLRSNRSSHMTVLKIMQHCAALDSAKRTLSTECEVLRCRLEEQEAQELLFNEELAAANSRYEALEQRLQDARAREPSHEALVGAKLALECELRALEAENSALKTAKVSLQDELTSLQHETRNWKANKGAEVTNIEGLTLEIASKTTETTLLREKFNASERECHTLNARLEALERNKQDMLKQFEVFLEEARHTREQLEEAWQERAEAEEQLGRARCELAVAGLRRESRGGGRESSVTLHTDTGDSPVFHLQQEVHSMVEEMATELVSLRRALQSEHARNERLELEHSSDEQLEVQQKLELVLRSNMELLQEKHILLEQLQNQGEVEEQVQSLERQMETSTQGDLLTQLAVYREQHTSLAEAIGTVGVLQETLRQQKEELLTKLQEKEAVEEQLATERAELRTSKLKMQLVEQQLQEKDVLYQELFHQKSNLETQLKQLEEKLKEREQMLQLQRTQLQAELRAQDMRLRRWQLQHRVSEVERQLDSTLRESSKISETPLEAETSASAADLHNHLETLRQEMHEAHAEAVARLKHHLDAEFALREQALRAGFNTELANTQATHKEQLASLQHVLLTVEKELENLRSAELMRMLGSDIHVSAELTTAKERYEKELESICSGLDESQAHLFAVLKHLFEEFARQLVAGTTALMKDENKRILAREVAMSEAHHQQELERLRATLENDHLKSLQVLQEVKVFPVTEKSSEVTAPIPLCASSTPVPLHSAHSSQVALVQLKHLLYSEYTDALKEVTKGWADNWKTEVKCQLETLEKALAEEALSLQRLRESPEYHGSGTEATVISQSLEELLQKTEQLTTRAEELLKRKVQVTEKALRDVGEHLDAAFTPVAERAEQMASYQVPKENTGNDGESERDQYRLLAQQLSAEHEAEADRLRELLTQLEVRRTREMEELRQYFEQKVQELEKHYSEEITSQHSRRHSSSSCDSDSEFTADALLGAGDHALNRIPPLTHICDSCAADPGYKELEERWRGELEKRVEEGRAQLSAAKKELESRYEAELATLKRNYEEKLSRLAQELTCAQQAAVQAAKANIGRCLQTLWRKEVRAVRARLLSVASHTSPQSSENGPSQNSLDRNVESSEYVSESQGKETLEDLCVELTSQLRQLEAAYKQSLLQQKEQLLKEKEEIQTECAIEHASTFSVQQVLTKVQLEEKMRKDVRAELEHELEQQVERVAALMKNNAEQEQNMFIENQNRIMKEFLEQHRRDLEILQQRHKNELSKTHKSSLHETTQTELLSPFRQHGISQTDEQQVPRKSDASVSPKHCVKLHREVQTEEPELLNVTMISQEVQTSPVKRSFAFLDASTENLRAQPIEANSLLLLSDAVPLSEPDDDMEDEHGGGFRRVLIDVQTEYAKHLQDLLVEWMNLLKRMKTGQSQSDGEMKFLSEEYIAESCSRFKALLSSLESKHLSEISKLQEALQRQRSLSRSPYSTQGECNEEHISPDKLAEITHERDRWRQVGLVLKKLVEELLNYLSECEDEVNNTLLNEPVGGSEVSAVMEVSVAPEEMSEVAVSPAAVTPRRNRRVRFAPTNLDFKNLISDEQMLLDCIREDEDLSAKLRVELDACLEHLRSEAAVLMENSDLNTASTIYKEDTMEGERIESLAQALTAARQRISDLEAERRLGIRSEEVAEGFGEQLSSNQQGVALGLRLQSLSQLQDKARSMLAGGRPSSPQEAQQLRLLDEICREGDRLADEARREREDLRQQVESADKRLRDTRRFLEEQAAEREQERDEFQQELVRLQDQLRAREKDLADHQRLSREVEALEQQGKEALARHQQLEAHRETLQMELKAAVDKVWLLRDVVSELELQAEAKDARSTHLETRMQELQKAFEEQEQSRQHLSEELESLRAEGGSELSRQVAALQEQLQAHRLQAEQYRPAVLKQMKAQIRELETSVERRTQQLEALHATSSNHSSPSEDVSVRDMFHSDSPEDMRAANASPSAGSLESSPRSPPPTPLPLKELARLQERLQRHARAEEAALKRTRDLEMQLKTARLAEEETSVERDVLQERVSEQLLRIASLEALVDAGRWKGTSGEDEIEAEDFREQQLLQQRAQDAEEEAERLAADLTRVRLELQQLKEAVAQAEAMSVERERTLATRLSCAEHAEAAARQRCEALENEADALRQAYEPRCAGRLLPLPVLFETLLADKNAEIDALHRNLQVYQVQVSQPDPSKAQSKTIGVEQGRTESEPEPSSKSVTCLCHRTTSSDDARQASSDGGENRVASSDDLKTLQEMVAAAPADQELRTQLEAALAEAGALREEVATLRTEAAEVAELQQMAEQLQTRMDAASAQLDQIGELEIADGGGVEQQIALLIGQLMGERARADALEEQLRTTSVLPTTTTTTTTSASSAPSEGQDESEGQTTQASSESKRPCVALASSDSESPVARVETPPEEETLRQELHEAQRALREAQEERDELRRAVEAAPGIEELAGQVEKELETSAQLDFSLLDHITNVEEEAARCVYVEPTQNIQVSDNVVSKIRQTIDGQTRITKHTIQLVQSAPAPSLLSPSMPTSNQHTQKLQQQVEQLHEQLHVQLQQMQIAARVHAQREQDLTKSIISEQERVSELQRTLRMEQHHALDLRSQLASHAVRAGLAIDEARLHQACREADQERERAQSLEQQLQHERSAVRQLKTALLTERQRFQAAQRRDAELLQTMRLRLGEKAATARDAERQLVFQVTPALLQTVSQPLSHAQPQSLPLPIAPVSEVVLSSGPRSLPSHSEDVWLSAEAHAELQRRLADAEEETKMLRRRLNREQETAQQLRTELNLLRCHNDGLDSQLSEVRASLAAHQAENDRQARRLRSLEEAELRQQNRASSERSLMQERARHLETNVVRLEAELAAERAVREDAVSKTTRLRMEVESLHREVDAASAAATAAVTVEVKGQPKSPTGEPLAQQIKDISASLDQQVKDHSKVALTLARLVEERGELQRKASALADQVLQLKASEEEMQAVVTRLTAEKASVTEECIALRLELARVKEQLFKRQHETTDTDELENRANHLFGRYLRAESYRKALAWQKKYLLVALGGYQQTEAYTLSRLAQLTSGPSRMAACNNGGRARARFKSVAMVIVAIERMKYLVRRWYHGQHISGGTFLNRGYSENFFNGRLSTQGLRRPYGSSAPSVSSWSVPASTSLGTMPLSPPSHDRCSSWVRTDSNRLPHWRSTEGLTGGLSGSLPGSLPPSRMAQFVERCDTLQQRLGLATAPVVILSPSPSPSSRRGES